MIDRIIRVSIEHRWLVMLAVAGFMAFGVYEYRRLKIDAVPDITNVQVQINARAPGYSPLEVESRVTFPVETAMGGTPKLQGFRSISKYGLSQVVVVFDEGTDIYFARQLVNERLQTVREQLPSQPAWAKSLCMWCKRRGVRSRRTVRLTMPPTCARFRIGSFARSCGKFAA
jgi:cobalt-zinc-cadmium resistance protein CzcA